jgi:hypothetical protein
MFPSDVSHVPNCNWLSLRQPPSMVTDISWLHHMQKCWGHKSFKRLEASTEAGPQSGD